MKFGMSGDKADAFGIRFYGNIDKQLESLGSLSNILYNQETPPFTEHKRITLWFTMEKLHPYERVSDLLGMLVNVIKREGYEVLISSIDELADTTTPEYTNKPEREFPTSNRMHGFNAAQGFSVTAEKNDLSAEFSREEIETIARLAVAFGRTVFGRELKKTVALY